MHKTPNHLDEDQLFRSSRSWLKRAIKGFTGGAVDENLPANAKAMGSIPGPGKSPTLGGN